MRKIFLDANIVIYSLDKNSEYYERALAVFSEAKEQGCVLVVSPFVLNEVHYFFAKMKGNAVASTVLKKLLSNKSTQLADFAFSKKDFLNVLAISSKYSLKTFDGFHAYYCKKLGIKEIATFDKDFSRVPFLRIVT